ncbi:cyclin-dependent kinase inhibitor 1Ba [Alosa sapidissima]|uniref:cyclin-dependent kinase inhibitor 1Ba n=1 Tax=Alosa sapidissima TaxID=34773 RepID=UPI001C0979AD|nr:cyclin-dependent kinase inhibitor 1Ba [Alosa sapidissima]
MWKMSNVRLSNGSPTLERVDSRSTDLTRDPVCRNLFGPVDHEEFKKDCKEQMQEMTRASTESWSFDFANNEPLSDGKFEWSEVDGRAVPEFYTRPPRIRTDSSDSLDHNGNHDLNTIFPTPCASGGGRSEDTDADRNQQGFSETRNPSRKRHASQESACRSKRANTSSREVGRSRDTTDLVEQTPNKSGPGPNHER